MKKHGPSPGAWSKAAKESLLDKYEAKSLVEVLEKVRKQKPDYSAAQIPSEYQTMKDTIKELEDLIGDFDIDSLDDEDRRSLAEIQIKTIEDVRLWKNGWVSLMKRAVVDGAKS